jgi:hypothetical protein
MILLITNKEDAHPTPVINYFRQNGIPVFRLNTEVLLTDYQFNWRCNITGIDFKIKNIKNELELIGSEITALWDRRPLPPKILQVDNPENEINKHNLEEAHGFLSFLRYYLSEIFSIGSIVYDRVSSSKMLQIKVAKELGMKVPATCFSNQKVEIINFAKDFDYISVKAIESNNIWLGDEFEYVFYAQKVKSSSLINLADESFIQTVSFIQNYVEKLYELRITVVCDKIFACKIDSQLLDEDKGKVDWRQGYDYGLKHEIYNLPVSISDFCLEYLKKMKLNFGCFDFIVTPQMEYVFLECNPNGQWLWIENETGMKISEAIANALMLHK